MDNTEPTRKGSDNSSSSAGGDKELKGREAEILDLQRKLKKLKDVYVKERMEKSNLASSLEATQAELEKYKTTLQEKETALLTLKSENAELREKLTVERKKTENQASKPEESNIGKYFGGLLSLPGGKQGNEETEKMRTENSYFKKQVESMSSKLANYDGQIEKVKKEARVQKEELEKKIQDLERELSNKESDYTTLKQDSDKLRNQNLELLREKSRLDDELRKSKRDTESIRQEKEDLEKSNLDKARLIDEIGAMCKKLEEEIKKLSQETEKAKNDLIETEMKLQIFNLVRIGGLLNTGTPAQLLVRKNVAGEFVIEIEHAGERLTMTPNAVVSFGMVEKFENRFFIQFKNSGNVVEKETFEAQDPKKILRYLKQFMKSLQTDGEKEKGGSATKKEKNVFSQVASFFGS